MDGVCVNTVQGRAREGRSFKAEPCSQNDGHYRECDHTSGWLEATPVLCRNYYQGPVSARASCHPTTETGRVITNRDLLLTVLEAGSRSLGARVAG